MTACLCSTTQQTSEDILHWPGTSWSLVSAHGGLQLQVFPFLISFPVQFPNTSVLKHAYSPHTCLGVPMRAVLPSLTTASTLQISFWALNIQGENSPDIRWYRKLLRVLASRGS